MTPSFSVLALAGVSVAIAGPADPTTPSEPPLLMYTLGEPPLPENLQIVAEVLGFSADIMPRPIHWFDRETGRIDTKALADEARQLIDLTGWEGDSGEYNRQIAIDHERFWRLTEGGGPLTQKQEFAERAIGIAHMLREFPNASIGSFGLPHLDGRDDTLGGEYIRDLAAMCDIALVSGYLWGVENADGKVVIQPESLTRIVERLEYANQLEMPVCVYLSPALFLPDDTLRVLDPALLQIMINIALAFEPQRLSIWMGALDAGEHFDPPLSASEVETLHIETMGMLSQSVADWFHGGSQP